MRATAAVLRDASAPYSIEPIELPDPGPGEVLVKVVSAGICHTDSLLRSMPSDLLPIVLGHEGAGVVEAVGAGVAGISIGDHVVLSFDSCGRCGSCAAHLNPYCDEFMVRNFLGTKLDGSPPATDEGGNPVGHRWFGQSSFATHAIATAQNTVVIDREVDLTLAGPLGCGLQTGAGSVLKALAVRPGTSIAVYGAGGVGLAAVMAARVAQAAQIIAVDRHQHRLDLAVELGATETILASDPAGLAAALQAVAPGGTQYAFDTTGVPGVVAAAVGALRQTGVCGLVGAGSEPIALDPGALFGKTVVGIFEGDADPHELIPELVALWKAGDFPIEKLVETYRLDQVDEAERASLDGSVIKPVLLPAAG